MTPEQIQKRIEDLQKAKQMWMSDDFKDSDWSAVVTHINMHIDDLTVFLKAYQDAVTP
jgi:hypothetical protein